MHCLVKTITYNDLTPRKCNIVIAKMDCIRLDRACFPWFEQLRSAKFTSCDCIIPSIFTKFAGLATGLLSRVAEQCCWRAISLNYVLAMVTSAMAGNLLGLSRFDKVDGSRMLFELSMDIEEASDRLSMLIRRNRTNEGFCNSREPSCWKNITATSKNPFVQ